VGEGGGQPVETVLVVDLGAQYAQLIARRVREARVHSEIVPADISPAEVSRRAPKGIILSGGPRSVYEPGAPKVDPGLYELGIPVLGICYGAQLLAQDLGGEVTMTGRGEYGPTDLRRCGPSLLLDGLTETDQVWMSHGDAIVAPPPGFTTGASTAQAPVAVMEDRGRQLYGVQFHPEVSHTAAGQAMLSRFLFEVSGCLGSWEPDSIVVRAVAAVRATVQGERALCALSGGVDSLVAAMLVRMAIGDRLHCVYVDTGFMRAGESEQVEAAFRAQFGEALTVVDGAERFLEAIAGLSDPEAKRKAVGEAFIRSFEEVARQRGDGAKFLVQGTLYPDVIESGSATAAKIKSHHNVGGLPERMGFSLVEPLRDLFKDEVRAVGAELGLAEDLIWRHPFPGPGLSVRVLGEVTPGRLEMCRQADAIVLEEIKRAGLYRQVWQAFAVVPEIRSVGVQGDGRTYGYPVVVRVVTSEDAMTADWAKLPYDVLESISSRIVNEVGGVNRVVYDITPKPPGTIEWE
jgi:GMP synthase (glutamine-hydrolysing)